MIFTRKTRGFYQWPLIEERNPSRMSTAPDLKLYLKLNQNAIQNKMTILVIINM